MLALDDLIAKSQPRLSGLLPALRADALRLIKDAYAKGIQVLITQGYRSTDQQNALYAQGRTLPGQIVTNARGGQSYHNFGLAFDICLMTPTGNVTWDTNTDFNVNHLPDWMEVVKLAKSYGLEWGGDWVSFKDMPHFQRSYGLTLSQLRAGGKPPMLSMDDGNAMIKILQGLWASAKNQADKDQYHQLANSIRVAMGQQPT